jgi:hypothetical protein
MKQLELACGRPIRRVALDRLDFEAFTSIYVDDRPFITEAKKLEYYLSMRFLEFTPEDVFIDVAAQNCPYAEFVRNMYGCCSYRQDLYYLDPGVNGWDIGGDAAEGLPFLDGQVTKIALHNSFEHFEGDRDSRFILEAERVLAPGGRMIIVPLDVAETPFETNSLGWTAEDGTVHLWGIGAQFGRTYDPVQLGERVISRLGCLTPMIYHLDNCGIEPFYFLVAEKQ